MVGTLGGARSACLGGSWSTVGGGASCESVAQRCARSALAAQDVGRSASDPITSSDTGASQFMLHSREAGGHATCCFPSQELQEPDAVTVTLTHTF